jgi:hypothetical protein
MMTHRFHVALVAFVFLFAARTAGAQCTPGTTIPNFRSVSLTTTTFTFAWDPPANAPTNAVYEIMRETDANYCAYQDLYSVTDSTTSTSYTAALNVPNSAYAFFVRLQSDHCYETPYYFAVDTFTTVPTKPAVPSVTAGQSSAALTFSYSDPHTFEVDIYRSVNGGPFKFLDFVQTCGSDPKTYVDSNLAPGTYQYRLGVFDDGTGGQIVYSDAVTATVGGTPPVVTSFAVAPSTIRAGQQATLSWVTQNAAAVIIDQGVGTQALSGTATVSPATTTTYTLSAMSSAQTATSSVTVNVITTPSVVVSSFPTAMIQAQGTGGATTSYTLSNAGGAATQVTLSQDQNFFTQAPGSFALAPGASQVVTITGVAQNAAGVLEGVSIPSGAGVAQGLQVPIKLLSSAPPTQPVSAQPSSNRVDVAADAGTSPTGTVSFTNSGNGTLTGVLVSDVPWIIPQSGIVTIPPHTTTSFTFQVDRSKRPDSNSLIGSLTGDISIVFLSGSAGKTAVPRDTTPPPSVSTVTVVDTVKLTVSAGAPPALASGEIALFIAGVGHVSSTVGVFISDISVLNPTGNARVDDLRLFFTPVGGGPSAAKTTAVPSLGTSVSIALADVVKNVFGTEGQVGSLQIRSHLTDKLGLNTNIFNASSPAGTYGTAIPTFRSDRAVAPGDRLVLSGLRQDATSHTNLFFQETAGAGATIQTEFFAADGTSLGTRSDTVGPFGLSQVNSIVPNGAVSATMTNSASSPGSFLAFATPVDNLSGDNWSVVDWSRQYGYFPGDPSVIPVAGVLHGANGTFFRTDLSITNTSGAQASGTLRFVSSAGTTADRQVTLGAHQTDSLADVIGSLFGLSSTSGYLLFTPATGTFAVTSRTYATIGSNPATYGTAVPALATSAALKVGSLRAIAALEDSALSTVQAARPATFRTNFGMVETSGNSATVRVTLRFTFAAGSTTQGAATASKDYNIAANQFIQINGLTADVLGAARNTFGDLHGIEADFQVINGNGAVTVYTSSTDNGTGDSILRTE